VTPGKITALLVYLRNSLTGHPDNFLRNISGVVHVGANSGQERDLYRRYGLKVLWVEPIPEVFDTLSSNIKGYPDQRAVQALVTDVDGKEYEFHIANNSGASSSILDFKEHTDIWPGVAYTNNIKLESVTLASLFHTEGIEPGDYQALIMDTQGSELLVLQGGLPVLENFSYIKTEVPDFESYAGCCQLSDISEFMTRHGYEELARKQFAGRKDGGNYYDIVYKKIG
jgi:FkbM family methyltransferase